MDGWMDGWRGVYFSLIHFGNRFGGADLLDYL